MIKPSSVSYVCVSVECQRRYACVDGEAGKGGTKKKREYRVDPVLSP